MSQDRRLYKRVILDLPTTIYLHGDKEIVCKIHDISEDGISISLDSNDELSCVNNGDIITFQSVDIFNLFDKETTKFINGSAVILRIQKEGNIVKLGCKFTNIPSSLSGYIRNKKIAIYIQNNMTL